MSEIVEKLRGAGISAREYAKPPSDNPFIISMDRRKNPVGTILVNEGLAAIDCYVDPKLRQAVLHVKENARKITRTYKGTTFRQESKPRKTEVHEGLQERFPVGLTTDKIRWEYTNVKIERKGWIDDIFWETRGTVTAHILVETELNLLLGMDETAQFIAALPTRVESVKEAHRVLKPQNKRLKKGTVRQGEWFFIPVSDAMERRLNTFVAGHARQVRPLELEPGSSHLARQALKFPAWLNGTSSVPVTPRGLKKGIYVCGYVIDDRAGHHEPLFFNHWHRVERNSELGALPTTESRVANTYTRMRTRSWD